MFPLEINIIICFSLKSPEFIIFLFEKKFLWVVLSHFFFRASYGILLIILWDIYSWTHEFIFKRDIQFFGFSFI